MFLAFEAIHLFEAEEPPVDRDAQLVADIPDPH
jgi:hypothetical protein